MNASHATSVLTIDIQLKRGKGTWIKTTTLATLAAGMTTSKYVQRMRMSKSCDLLQFSKLNAEEIAWRSGYADAAPSARSFTGTWA